MQTVRDRSGARYLLVKRSADSWLVRDPETGTEQYRPASEFDAETGVSPLVTAAEGVPEPLRRTITAAHDERALGLLVELVDREELAVRDLLSAYDLCERDLHGLLAEFTAAGLIEETTVAGERGVAPTDDARTAIASLRQR